MIIGIYVVGGMLMDSAAFLVVSLPIFFPVAMSLRYDPTGFLLLITVVTSLGAVTPPGSPRARPRACPPRSFLDRLYQLRDQYGKK